MSNPTDSRIRLVPFSENYLDLSWTWLRDPEIRALTLAPNFTRDDQRLFFNSLSERKDYMIWGVEAGNDEAIGACGLKNIVANMAEYWCYIGNRSWWGRGVGRQILEECEAKAKKIGITDLYMKASSCNDRSIGLYTKMGFVLDDEKSNSGIHYFIKSKI